MIQLPLVYKAILESKKNQCLLYGGRLGGKTNGTAIVSVLAMLENPYTDVVVARVSYGSMKDSSYAEIEHAIDGMGEEIQDEFILKKSPLRIVRKGDAGTIYFIGYGGSNTSRTKSIRTKHPIKIVILEETQELKDERNLDEALASFRRHYGENVKVFVLGNPPPQEAHWFNRFIKKKSYDTDWLVQKMTWEDIVPFINDYDLKEILKMKIFEPERYQWFYMGEATGGFGSVYPMFNPKKHIITATQWSKVQESGRLKIVACIIGGDGAVNRDSTSFVPILLLNNGQSVIGDIFFHSPMDDGVISYHQLVQDHLTRWFDKVCGQYRLGTRAEMYEAQRRGVRISMIPVYMVIDSAAPDLIQECRFFMSDRATIMPVRKRAITEMVGICQSTISSDNMRIIDYGGYYDYVKNKWISRDNMLAEQINMLIWNEKQNGYDNIVPNDCCDAWTYGNIFWYANIENINYFNVLKLNGVKNITINDIIKGKE